MTGLGDYPGGPRIGLREVLADDLLVFYQHQLDPEASWMAAFTPPNPADRRAFLTRWARALRGRAVTARTVLVDERIAGTVLGHDEDGRPEGSYWIGREVWDRGVATAALAAFLTELTVRPVYAGAAKDTAGSLRVLAKCGFQVVGEDRGFANARGAVIEEFLLELSPGLPAGN